MNRGIFVTLVMISIGGIVAFFQWLAMPSPVVEHFEEYSIELLNINKYEHEARVINTETGKVWYCTVEEISDIIYYDNE
jgi:hypothetical protein